MYTLALRTLLSDLLSSINCKIELRKYSILLPESNSSSLASLLHLSKEQLVHILQLYGLISIDKKEYVDLPEIRHSKK